MRWTMTRLPAAPSLAWWAVLLACAIGAALPLLPPADTGAGADPAEFSATRAFEHVQRIAREPRPMGGPTSARAREYITAELSTLGLAPERQALTVPDYYAPSGPPVTVVNLIARIPGTAPTGAVALVAHYDTVPASPGANDDAAAVAAILETARAVLAGAPLRNDVLLLFTDGEEPAPRYSSSAFVGKHPWADEIGFVVNLEAIGTTGPSLLVEMNGPDGWLLEGLAATPQPAAFSFLTELVDRIGGAGSDFDLFRAHGVAGFHFAYLHGSPSYHTARDSIDHVAQRSLQQQGSSALSLARHFGDVDLTAPHDAGSWVFFTVLRSVVVRYPAGLALPLAAAAALLFAGIAARRVRRAGGSPWGPLMGAASVIAAVLVAALTTSVSWRVLAAVRPSPGVIESYSYLAALLALACAIGTLVRQRFERRRRTADTAAGSVLAWLVLAVFTSALLPGASYLFAWPAIAGAAVLAWPAGPAGPAGPARRLWWTDAARLALVAGPTFVVIVPAVDVFFQLAQPRPGNPDSQLIDVVAVVLALAVLVFELIRSLAPLRDNGLPAD